MKMNPELEAILAAVDSKDHLLIQAVAGSGKTTTLLEICRRLDKSASARFVAFNRHIAQELKTRVPNSVWVNTLHSMGLSMLKQKLGRQPEIDDRKYQEWIDKGLREAATKGSFFKVPVSKSAREFVKSFQRGESGNLVRDLNQVFGFVTNQTVNPTAIDVEHALERISLVFPIESEELAGWMKRLVDAGVWEAKEKGRLGFIDMLMLPAVWNLQPAKCGVMLVDEFQDLTPLQFELVRKSAGQGSRIIMVGDSHQAIYGFAGATGDGVEWLRSLPGNVREFSLPYSWRCDRAIVEKAQEIVPAIRAGEMAGAGSVKDVDTAEFYAEVAPGDLVLARYNAPLVRVFLGLLSRGVPVLVRGNDIEKGLIRAMREIGEIRGFTFLQFECLFGRADLTSGGLYQRWRTRRFASGKFVE